MSPKEGFQVRHSKHRPASSSSRLALFLVSWYTPASASSRSFKKPCHSEARAHEPLARDEFILHSPTNEGEFDAWARIRTWEPLREGILSPSPLTRLGYPRAARETPGAVKPFLVRRSRAPARPRFRKGLFHRGGSRGSGTVGAILHASLFPRGGESPQRGSRMVQKSRGHHGESRPDVRRPQGLLPDRRRERNSLVLRGRRRHARRLQVRRDLRRLDPARERREGFPEPRDGWQDSVPRFHAQNHGLDGSPQSHHRGGAGCPEGFLTERPKRLIPTAMDASSRMPIPTAVATNTMVQALEPTIATWSGPAMRKWPGNP